MGSRSYLLPAAAVLGLATGFGVSHLGGGPAVAPASAAEATPPSPLAASSKRGGAKGAGHDAAEKKITLVKPGALPKSTDTVESLLKLERGPLYARLGLWLLDASEEDMTAFWEGYYQREDPNDTIKDLLFTQWGKKNAAGMLAIARRTGCEVSAMWSWSLSDPEGMLAYVDGKDPRMRNYGLRGLGYFHPELARQMLDRDPALANTFEMEQLAEALSKGDPQAEMEFMGKYRNDNYSARQGLKKWAAEDPHRAFEWLKDRGGDPYLRREFFDTVKKEHPEVLPELAATLPNGAMRREIESAALAQLAATDPDKALEEAGKLEVPRLAAERLALVGKALAAEDPARAFEVLNLLLEKCPDAPYRPNRLVYPDGSSSSGIGVAGVPELLQTLAAKAPEQTLQTLMDFEAQQQASSDSSASDYRASAQVAREWAHRDLDAFTAWSEAQEKPELRDMGASLASEQMRDQNNFESAASWALRITDGAKQKGSIGSLMSNWISRDRPAAQSWFEQADLSEDARKYVEQYYFPSKQQ